MELSQQLGLSFFHICIALKILVDMPTAISVQGRRQLLRSGGALFSIKTQMLVGVLTAEWEAFQVRPLMFILQ